MQGSEQRQDICGCSVFKKIQRKCNLEQSSTLGLYSQVNLSKRIDITLDKLSSLYESCLPPARMTGPNSS